MGFGSFWGQKSWPCSKHGSQRQTLLRSSWNGNLAKPNLSLLWHSTVQNLSNGIDSWLEQPSVMATLECPQDLARSNWKVEFISQIELQILWLGSWQIHVSTDTWLWQSAPSACAKWPIPASLLQQKRSQNLRCWLFNLDRRGSFSCLSDTAFAYYIILQSISLSLANYHPVDCSPNMRVADCSTVWVCKRLQLMYLSALHLTLFDIYSTTVHSNEKNASVKRVCLSAMAIYEGLEFLSRLWFAPEHHKW